MVFIDLRSPSPPRPVHKKPPTSPSSSLLRIIAVAVCFVLAFHWHLVLHHVHYHAPRDPRHPGDFPGWGAGSLGGERYRPRYFLSPVCRGCHRARGGDGQGESAPCFDLIERHLLEHAGTTLREASREVGAAVAGCAACDPERCYPRRRGGWGGGREAPPPRYRTKYWRFDQTAPRVAAAASLALPSIPDDLRIPPARYADIEAYVRAKYARPDPRNITNVFLFEYNPGLAPVPAAMRAHLPWNARYVLSLRVTPHNFCFPVSA